MDKSPLEKADCRADSRNIRLFLRNPNIHCDIHSGSPLHIISGHINQGHTLRRIFFISMLIFFLITSGVGLSPLYCCHFWPVVPAPDDRLG
jgi:hypothetical protein